MKMKRLFALVLLSELTACSKHGPQPVASVIPQPTVSHESKHGYELAKTWDKTTAKEKDAEAEEYYTGADRLNYEICVNEAQQESACKVVAELPAYQTPKTRKSCAIVGLGPKHTAQCNALIDELPKLIERLEAAGEEELKK